MKLKLLLGAVILVCSIQSSAQKVEVITEKMNKLSALIGDWEGSGWYQQGRSERHNIKQHEHIESKLNGTVLLVEGKGYIADTLSFNALAFFSFDQEKNSYKIESHLADGKSTIATGSFNENGQFIWGFKVPQGNIRYTMTITDTTWNEYGEYSSDGEQWWEFMEMNLTKK